MTEENKTDVPVPEENRDEGLAGMLEELAVKMEKAKDEYLLARDIQRPIPVSGVSVFAVPSFLGDKCGSPVRVRLVGDDRTYLGIYLGDLNPPGGHFVVYHKPTQEIRIPMRTNPAIFVPALRRVVWGSGSWWALIKDSADLERAITDADIEGQPYVQMLRELAAKDGDR